MTGLSMVDAGGQLTPIYLNNCSSALQLGRSGEGHSCRRPLVDLERSGRHGVIGGVRSVAMIKVLACLLGDLGVEW